MSNFGICFGGGGEPADRGDVSWRALRPWREACGRGVSLTQKARRRKGDRFSALSVGTSNVLISLVAVPAQVPSAQAPLTPLQS